MDISEMTGNECEALEKDEDLHLDNIQMLEIAEAINHLDGMISEVERALHLNGQ